MFQVFEDNPGYQQTATSLTIDYTIVSDGGLEYWAARAALLNFAPISNSPPGATYAWPRRGLSLKEASASGTVWKGSITWSSLTYQYAMKIGGSSQQIRCDKTLVNIYSDSAAPTGSVPDYAAGDAGRPIGWDGRSVHGCSIYVPTVSWTESVEIPQSQYTFDYENNVMLVNKAPVNLYAFRGFQPGEVRFNGMQAQLSTKNPDFVTASYEFEQTSNQTNLRIDDITGISKDGWDYLDVHYEPQVPGGLNCVIPKALFVLVHRVYTRSDFVGLNIGTDESLPIWQG